MEAAPFEKGSKVEKTGGHEGGCKSGKGWTSGLGLELAGPAENVRQWTMAQGSLTPPQGLIWSPAPVSLHQG